MNIFSRFILVVLTFWLSGLSTLNAAFFQPTNVAQLITDITTANSNNDNDTIELSGLTFVFTASNNSDNNEGLNALPNILSDNSHTLTIQDGVLNCSQTSPTGFRIIRVAAGAELFLNNFILENGLANDDNLAESIGSINRVFKISHFIKDLNFVKKEFQRLDNEDLGL